MFDKVLNTPLYACNFSEDTAIGILQKISEQQQATVIGKWRVNWLDAIDILKPSFRIDETLL